MKRNECNPIVFTLGAITLLSIVMKENFRFSACLKEALGEWERRWQFYSSYKDNVHILYTNCLDMRAEFSEGGRMHTCDLAVRKLELWKKLWKAWGHQSLLLCTWIWSFQSFCLCMRSENHLSNSQCSYPKLSYQDWQLMTQINLHERYIHDSLYKILIIPIATFDNSLLNLQYFKSFTNNYLGIWSYRNHCFSSQNYI